MRTLASSSDAARACRTDLDALPAFLIENDTGAPAHRHRHGEAALEAALAREREAAARVVGADQALVVLRRYLAAWRPGHLGVTSSSAQPAAAPKPKPNDAPRLTLLSPKALLLTLPSFEPRHRARLEQLLAEIGAEFETRPHWVVDVRGNPGGSDHTYAPLLAWLIGNEWISVGVEFLATPANIAAHERLGQTLGQADLQGAALLHRLIAALRAAAPGTWARLEEERDGFTRRQPEPVSFRRPARVAVLIDRDCGSAGEQFLLDVRQSRSVKLLGRPTRGVLDHSNVRPHPLPSGAHVLWYATSRSLRLPHFPIDGIGVAPDVYLPAPHDAAERDAEILAAQHFLDSGH